MCKRLCGPWKTQGRLCPRSREKTEEERLMESEGRGLEPKPDQQDADAKSLTYATREKKLGPRGRNEELEKKRNDRHELQRKMVPW